MLARDISGEIMSDNEFENHEQDRQIEYAGFWIRAGAFAVDAVFLSLASLLAAIPVLFFLHNFAGGGAHELAVQLRFLVNWALPAALVILFWRYRQATPGKMVLRLKIVDARGGGKLSAGQCIGRYFAYFLSFLVFGFGFLWIIFDARKQGWHDKLAGTYVIKTNSRAE